MPNNRVIECLSPLIGQSGYATTGDYYFYCPGCQEKHLINTSKPRSNGAIWQFSGTLEKPTFTPSIHIRTGKYVNEAFDDEEGMLSRVCHSFVNNGNIQFLNDCTHPLAGQTVPLPIIK